MNIHVLPTDKPNRLIHNALGYGMITNEFTKSDLELIQAKYKSIYITSDEKFIRDEYVTDGIQVIKATKKLVDAQGLVDRRDWNKIILTTAPDLFKDGVQAIDDEFLEWFVKNPSCERVEIQTEKVYNKIGDNISYYKTIIPKEETKQQCCENTNGFYLGTTCPKCNKPFRSIIQQLDMSKYTMGIDPYDEKETLEEIAERWNEKQTTLEFGKPHNSPNRIKAFIEGAKSQQEQYKKLYSEEQMDNAYDKGFKDASERSYSEEDLKEAFYQGWVLSGAGVSFREAIDKWFKHLKNK